MVQDNIVQTYSKMSSTTFWASKCQNFLKLLKTQFRGTYLGQSPPGGTAMVRLGGYGSSMQQGWRLMTFQGRTWTGSLGNTNMENNGNNQVPPPGPHPPRFSFPKWARWVLGSVVSVVLPFWKQNWDKLQTIEGETEIVLDEIEDVAKVVEKVANAADKIAEDLAELLPDKSKLKEGTKFVEHVAEATAHNAQLVINFIDKVEEVKQDVEDLEDMVEPVIDKIGKMDSEEKKEK